MSDGDVFERLPAVIAAREGGIDIRVNSAGDDHATDDRGDADDRLGPGQLASAPARPRPGSAVAIAVGRTAPNGRRRSHWADGRVLFLASDMARMCSTGIALDVDGGVLISNDLPYEEYFARAR